MKMVNIVRYGSIPGMGTFGSFKTHGWSCVTVEREWLDNEHDISCIPPGQYTCSLVDSPKHGEVYQVLNVPNRSMIEIHPANVALDLLGCIGLGKEFISMATKNTQGRVMWGVSKSQDAVAEFMHLMGGDDFILSIEKA